ncbi:Endonuclease/exonuclease/phosphatase, partial [Armillaria luteobubalina]
QGRRTKCPKNTKASIKIAALNIRGMGNTNSWHPENKWNHINQIMQTKRIGIMIVGETHLNDERRDAVEGMPRSHLRIIHSEDPESPNARGVAIVLNKELTTTESIRAVEIIPGRVLLLETCWHGMEKLSILGVYVPASSPPQNAQFWTDIRKFFEDNPDIRRPDVMAGDMNITEDSIDRIPAKPDNASAVDSLDEMRTELQLIDGWRTCYPTTLKYTWHCPATGSQSRIDRIYVKNNIYKHCYEWGIEKAGVPTDHDMVTVRFSTATAPKIGHGRWVMPLHVVKDSHVKGFILRAGHELQESIEKCVQSEHRTSDENPQKLWEVFTEKLCELARQWAKAIVPNIDKEIHQLEAEITAAENSANLGDESSKTNLMILHERLDKITQLRHRK